jgi:hypothetical protein
LRGINIIARLLLLVLQELYLLQREPESLSLLHVVHEVYVVRGVLALVRVLQQVPFQHALHVNQ